MNQRSWLITLLVAVAMIGVAAVSQRLVMKDEAPRESVVEEPTASTQDSGPMMDLEHLTQEDLDFLAEVLAEGSPEARVSATRALAVSADLRGVPLLFEHAVVADDQAMTFCIGALEILRLARADETWLALTAALEQPLDPSCRTDVSQRLSMVGATHAGDLTVLLEHPEPQVRVQVLRQLSESGHAESALLRGVEDEDLAVRRTAWLLLDGRDSPERPPRFADAASNEVDPELRELAQEVVSRW